MSLPLREHAPPGSATETMFEAFTMVSACQGLSTLQSGKITTPISPYLH